jgi:hypothetical protein
VSPSDALDPADRALPPAADTRDRPTAQAPWHIAEGAGTPTLHCVLADDAGTHLPPAPQARVRLAPAPTAKGGRS